MDLLGSRVRRPVVRGLAAVVMLASVLVPADPVAVAQQGTPYGDVPPGAFYAEAVTALAADGVFAGTECAEGFCPADSLDRATMAVWTVRVLDGQDPPGVISTRFADVDGTHPFGAFIERFAELEVTRGCDDTNYCPDGTVTRAQMAVFLSRAFDLAAGPDPGFGDVRPDAWYAADVAKLAASGITAGCGDGANYCPGDSVTRAQMALFLARALESPEEDPGHVEEAAPAVGGGFGGGGGGGGSGGGGGGTQITSQQRTVEAPGVPRNLVVAVEGHTTLEVGWDAPHSDGGDSNLSYVVQRRAGATDGWSTLNVDQTLSDTGLGHRAEITNLVNGVIYQIQVAARNGGGTGPWSAVVEGEPTATDPPERPSSLSIRPGSEQLAVSWPASSDLRDFASVTYEVGYRESGGGWTTFASDETGRSVTITNLDNGVAYDVRVASRYENLTSTYTEGTGTPVGSRPSLPQYVTEPAGNGGLSLSWQAPDNLGGYDISFVTYSVQYRRGRSGSFTPFTFDDTQTSVTITGLDNGVEYQVQVAAKTPAGSSSYVTRTATPKGTAPGAPTIDTVTAGNGRLTVEWSAPSNTGGYADSFLRYSVEYRKTASTGDWTVFAASLSSRSSTITGLENGVSYDVQVAASNPAGAGDYSSPRSRTPEGTAPGKPGSVRVTAGNGELGVVWNKPSTGGYADSFLTYDVQYRRADADTADPWLNGPQGVTGTSATIPSLSNGMAYDVQVQANNPIGPSGYTNPVEGTPVGNVSGVPTSVSVTAGQSGELEVSWTAPSATGGYDVSQLTYSVQYRRGTTGGWTTFASAATGTSTTITGLDNGFEYQVHVATRNPANLLSPYSAAKSATPEGDAPGKPTGVSVTAGKNRLSVSWSAPTGTGGYAASFLTYTVEIREGSSGTWSDDGVTVSGRTATITGLDNGVDYQVQVETANPAGTSGFTDPPVEGTPVGDRPGAPTISGVTEGDGLLTVSWDAPTDTGGYDVSFLSYVVEYRKGSTGSFTTFASAETGTTVTIPSLDNGYQYQVRVATNNPTNLPSPYATATGTPEGRAPDPPTNVSVSAPANQANQLEVSWDAPTGTGGYDVSFLSYVVEYRESDTAGSWLDAGVSISGTMATITGLYNGIQYDVQVAATNPADTSGFASDSGTPVGTAPGAPGSLSVQAGQDGELLVSWAVPSNTGGYADSFLTYDVQYRRADADAADPWTDGPQNVTGTSTTITGLDNGVAYDVQVLAENPAGASGYTTPKEGTPSGTEPSAVRNLAVTAGDTKLDVSWDAPADNGGYSTLTYRVQHRKRYHSGSWSSAGVTITGTTAEITGLDNGQEYDVRVRASNDAGHGPYTRVSAAPEGTLPGTPGNLMVEAKNKQLKLTWDAPTDGGYDSLSYVVEYRTGSEEWRVFGESAGNSTNTETTISRLFNGTSYDVRVFAKNALGSSTAATSTGTPVGTLPGAPRHVAARPGHESLDITWSAPQNTGGYGSATLTYTVEFKQSGSTDAFSDTGVTVTGTSAAITGLTNGTAYEVRVGASNGAGAGTAYGTVTATPNKSFKSRDVVVTGGSGSLEVAWSPPAAPSSEIDSYDIQYRLNGTQTWTEVADVTSPHTISSLTANASYDVQVGTNDTSASATVWSDTVTVSARPAPPATWISDWARMNEGKPRVRWGVVGGANAPTGYKIQWKREGEDWDPVNRQMTVNQPSGTAREMEVDVDSGRDNDGDGTVWDIRIIPYNLGGDGPARSIAYTQLTNEAEYNVWAEENIIEPLAADWQWLGTAWDFLDSRPGVNIELEGGGGSFAGRVSITVHNSPTPANRNLPVATFGGVTLNQAPRRATATHVSTVVHELAHVYTQTTDIAAYIDDVAPIGMLYLYINEEYPNSPFDADCYAHELMADLITAVVMKDADEAARNGDLPSLFELSGFLSQYLLYWRSCARIDHDEPNADDEAFIRSVLSGSIPDWFTDTYGGDAGDVYSADYDGNAALVWKHLRRFQATDSTNASFRVVPLNYFSKLFGGYCSNSAATNEAKTKGIPTAGRNPWANGGC